MRSKMVHSLVLPLAGVAFLFLPACGEQESQAPAIEEPAGATTTATPAPNTPKTSRLAIGAEIGDEPLLPGDATGAVLAFDVEGMTCSNCATTIHEAVSPLAGVEALRVSLLKNVLWVRVTADGTITPEAIIEAIAVSGDYTATVSTDDDNGG